VVKEQGAVDPHRRQDQAHEREQAGSPRRRAGRPDRKHLLAASRTADAVALFRQDGIFSDGFESGDTSIWSNGFP
jgi:hypothetical protein